MALSIWEPSRLLVYTATDSDISSYLASLTILASTNLGPGIPKLLLQPNFPQINRKPMSLPTTRPRTVPKRRKRKKSSSKAARKPLKETVKMQKWAMQMPQARSRRMKTPPLTLAAKI
jgi:hypothetical protein